MCDCLEEENKTAWGSVRHLTTFIRQNVFVIVGGMSNMVSGGWVYVTCGCDSEAWLCIMCLSLYVASQQWCLEEECEHDSEHGCVQLFCCQTYLPLHLECCASHTAHLNYIKRLVSSWSWKWRWNVRKESVDCIFCLLTVKKHYCPTCIFFFFYSLQVWMYTTEREKTHHTCSFLFTTSHITNKIIIHSQQFLD